MKKMTKEFKHKLYSRSKSRNPNVSSSVNLKIVNSKEESLNVKVIQVYPKFCRENFVEMAYNGNILASKIHFRVGIKHSTNIINQWLQSPFPTTISKTDFLLGMIFAYY